MKMMFPIRFSRVSESMAKYRELVPLCKLDNRGAQTEENSLGTRLLHAISISTLVWLLYF